MSLRNISRGRAGKLRGIRQQMTGVASTPIVRMNRDAAAAAIKRTERSVDRVGDRASRLIRAALDDAPVQPVDPAKAPLLQEFERWSQVPIREAFGRLDALAPGLAALGVEAEAWAAAHPGASEEARIFQSLKRSRKA